MNVRPILFIIEKSYSEYSEYSGIDEYNGEFCVYIAKFVLAHIRIAHAANVHFEINSKYATRFS